MSAETPDERIPQEPGIPGPDAEPPDPPERDRPDGSERPAEPEAPDQEGQRAVKPGKTRSARPQGSDPGAGGRGAFPQGCGAAGRFGSGPTVRSGQCRGLTPGAG